NDGYPESISAHFCGEAFERETVAFGTRAAARATRIRDLPCAPEAVPTFSAVLSPEGFKEGLTICLWASHGGYAGVRNLSTKSTSAPSDAARDAIELLAGTLGNVVDLTPFQRCLIDWLEPGATAFLIGSAGATVPLTPESPATEGFIDALNAGPDAPISLARTLLPVGFVPSRFLARVPAAVGGRSVPGPRPVVPGVGE